MPTKKGMKKKIIKKITKKGPKGSKGNVSQSVVVNIHKGKSAPKQVSSATLMKPTIASTLSSGLSAIASSFREQPIYSAPPQIKEQVKASTPVPKELEKNKTIPINELLTMLPKVENPQKLNKSELGEKKNMFQEDLASEKLRYIPEVPKVSFDEAQRKTQEQLNYYNERASFSTPYKNETEVEGIPLVEAEVKSKRKYVKSGKYSKKKSEELIPEEP
jgi:hypothetical protein